MQRVELADLGAREVELPHVVPERVAEPLDERVGGEAAGEALLGEGLLGDLDADVGLACAAGQLDEGPRVVLNQAETSQMESRMKYFWLSHSLPEEQVVRVASCAHCAARLYLEGRPAALPGPPPPAAARSRSPRREA